MSRLTRPTASSSACPTPLTDSREPDLSYIEGTAAAIAKTLRPGQLVVLESTTYPGTTRVNVLPILEATGLKCGRTSSWPSAPSARTRATRTSQAATIPKVVGGLDDDERASSPCALYGQAVVKVVRVSSCEVAEACKILENTYRAVNIALVNELKVLYDRMGIDVWEVIDAAKTKPFGFQAFYPGPGLGGHCIPIDPFYLTWVARKHGEQTRFIELAGEINTQMPALRRRPAGRRPQRPAQAGQGQQDRHPGHGLQEGRGRPARKPGVRADGAAAAHAGPSLTYNDPHIPALPPMRHYPDLPRWQARS